MQGRDLRAFRAVGEADCTAARAHPFCARVLPFRLMSAIRRNSWWREIDLEGYSEVEFRLATVPVSVLDGDQPAALRIG